ncbi:hypothetical protein [Nocardia asteroides]|uniref:hypothetical protein n=1 Tax=Nocardia asteroides TaxID=1824 RepID=UPI001E35FCFE|nr:hypothetical protein [Nocardia asteroides]UGT59938.1 hypothetical protein LTT61_22300 [Nocardia asteroides]
MGFEDWFAQRRRDVGPSSAEIIGRVEAERQDALHAVPEQPFTVEQAHREMRRHRACRAADCPRKKAAQDVLVRAKRMVPADREAIGTAQTPDRGLRRVRAAAAGKHS